MKKSLLAICLALPVAAIAQDFSCDYTEAAYTEGEYGELDDRKTSPGCETGDFTASVSARFYPNRRFSVSAGYSYAVDNEIDTGSPGLRYDLCCC